MAFILQIPINFSFIKTALKIILNNEWYKRSELLPLDV